jgi:hypothetical protein
MLVYIRVWVGCSVPRIIEGRGGIGIPGGCLSPAKTWRGPGQAAAAAAAAARAKSSLAERKGRARGEGEQQRESEIKSCQGRMHRLILYVPGGSGKGTRPARRL